ncbi:uncharacterized protein LTR77_006933 [Saxophila tyrrhenica]|uniref:Transcriptional regulatory protein RXT2 N-terminal domain-containing protein n=1 Tax=Saxophila tyrrhenica TaxID=1690608 RepID=A0AAV9P6R0_9PEZI|nr:hypothetical protein LTR77_006933 [Saxophila tyrrhenica]
MANQQAQFAETIRSMKVALKRRADDSEDDPTTANPTTNRGHKHHRTSANLHPSRLNTTLPRTAYRKPVSHAGYIRPIISHNPTLYDPDGDVVSPTDSDAEERGVGEAVDENPFGDVKLEELLRPLTSAAELSDHPSLSLPYKSRALTLMADEASEMLRREREVLWRAKRLLRRFRGDGEWMPCEAFEGEGDEGMLVPSTGDGEDVPSVALDAGSSGAMQSETEEGVPEKMQVDDTGNGMGEEGVEAADMALQQAAAEAEKTAASFDGTTENSKPADEQPTNTAPEDTSPTAPPPLDTNLDPEPSTSDPTSTPTTNTHAMTTRARARSPADNDNPTSPAPSSPTDIPPIHPWFLHPATAIPARDLDLPAPEAEETRRMLLLYIQKQSHIVRQLSALSTSLLKADRLRNSVWCWTRAEGHLKTNARGERVTEMSDGEDWVDVEGLGLRGEDLRVLPGGEWGLEKGREEVEEEEERGRRGRRRGVKM